jgi:hypothetical protein
LGERSVRAQCDTQWDGLADGDAGGSIGRRAAGASGGKVFANHLAASRSGKD